MALGETNRSGGIAGGSGRAAHPRRRSRIGDRKRSGFTLIELTITVAIIALLAVVATGQYLAYVERAKVDRAKADILMIALEVERFRSHDFTYPPDLATLGLAGKLDPWGRPYHYTRLSGPGSKGKARKDHKLNPLNSDFDLFSAGKDGVFKTQIDQKFSRDDVIAAGGAGFATAFLDLDRFKSINDGLGHAFGDDILVEIARRIRGAVASGDFVARLGGDEFFLILPGVTEREQAARTMRRLADAFDPPVVVGQRELQQRFSVGVAFHPADGADAATLIRAADMAMYRVKKSGGNNSGFFDASMDRAAQERLQMENDLRTAIHERRIALHYQPRVDCRDGRVVGLEALARWVHPDGGMIAPGAFIGLAEECGLIDELGALVIDEACRQLAEWRALGLRPPRVGVNVSGHQLASTALVPTLSGAMARWAVEPECLEIEVTETALVRDSESGGRQLQAARELGVQVAIDDFGTGYSSLAYLMRLPSDTLKIDRTFVVELERGEKAVEAVVRSIIGIARDLGKAVVAEGVESVEQVRALDAWGCHVIQGYVYSRPLPADAITRLLAGGGIVQPVANVPVQGPGQVRDA